MTEEDEADLRALRLFASPQKTVWISSLYPGGLHVPAKRLFKKGIIEKENRRYDLFP